MAETEFTRAAQALKESEAILITAGAGMGVDSGLPDFRGNEGFWNAYPPMRHLGIGFADMANPQWFDMRPALAWGFYGHRLNLYRETLPHQGFHMLLNYAQTKKYGYFVFTSNVDGQFQKAGFAPDRVEEVHGSIHHLQCTDPCSQEIWSAESEELIIDEQSFTAKPPLPVCPKCGQLARPNILMFGDWGWISDRSSRQSLRLEDWFKVIPEGKLVVIEMGAGLAVPTVRYKSEAAAGRNKGVLIRINPRDMQVPGNNISIQAGALEGLSNIFALLD